MAKKRFYATDVLPNEQKNSAPMTLTKLSEGSITGAIIGTVGGVLYSKFNNKNIYLCGFVGMLIGGVISKVITM